MAEGTVNKVELSRTAKKSGPLEVIRQSYVVMKNEIKKFFSGKRMMVFSLILAAIIFVLAVAPYLVGSTAKPFMFVAVASLVVLMGNRRIWSPQFHHTMQFAAVLCIRRVFYGGYQTQRHLI